MKTVAVIPAFNEASVIAEVVTETLEYVDLVIVVDDGSRDDTAKVAKSAGAEVLRHVIQRGVGRSTSTGLQAALLVGADFIVTIDADGQHLPSEIESVLEPLRDDKADLVIGSRVLDRKRMPLLRRMGNRFANFWTWILLGVAVSDSQSGFRAYTRDAAKRLPLDARGYEFCSLTLGEAIRIGLRIFEVPITVIYTEYSRSKGQGFFTSVKTLGQITKESLR